MKIKHASTTTDGSVTTTEPNAWLPGFAPCPSRGCGTQAPPGADAMPKPAAVWWVRSSNKQKLDKLGLPSGFTHELMFGSRRIKSGQGADDRRQLEAQAAFFNEKGVQPSDSKSKSC
jgi:hypothetical protein